MRMQRNPGTHKRNQNLVLRKGDGPDEDDGPRFRSEQERRSRSRGRKRLDRDRPAAKSDDEAVTTDEESAAVDGPHESSGATRMRGEKVSRAGGMPKRYKRVEIRYSRFGIEDFDFGYYNSTHYAGLETHITNSYTNALLQVLYFLEPIRLYCKSHLTTSCAKEHCLLCELGFLFRMLEDSKGANCQASNFLKAFATVPQGHTYLGVLE